uniref:RBR-type E3 ubiquitin transferase n=1 Tax=Romanomermis culicivorax TaxID=13658 RepID=A0A915K898_ROMCU
MSNDDLKRLLIIAQLKADDSPNVNSATLSLTKYFTVNDENLNFIEENSDSPVEYSFCPICLASAGSKNFLFLSCKHKFCKFCWRMHIRIQMDVGCSSRIECMNSTCHLLLSEDRILDVLQSSPHLLARYLRLSFQDLVQSHPCLRYCPGPDCSRIIYANCPLPRRVLCEECRSSYCFLCGLDYHAPADCETIRKWLTKCADDSETANYLTANTKDCPHCGVCIEKSGGCNHMACSKCKYHFCWVCTGDWKNHGSQYYECSKYKENPNVANESLNSAARKALEKYLFYYERWENHQKSLKMEETTMKKIRAKIDDKVNRHDGTWIDWQYLYDAAALLTKCRYTLQYTYPFAYYAPNDSDKALFEYQQSQLESEIENLAWKVEHDEETKRADMERQMHVAEMRRKILLKKFAS